MRPASRAKMVRDRAKRGVNIDVGSIMIAEQLGALPVESAVTAADENDPNADADWDWTVDETYDLFAATPADSLARFQNIRLPYFAGEGPAADDFNNDAAGARDIAPEDGWVLLYRDFGTPDRGAVPPRFMLYNRYRGLLRLFYFNPYLAEAYAYGIVALRKQSVSEPFGLLTFTDDDHTSLADFDPEREELSIGRLVPLTWNYADFLVAGYDPETPEGAKLDFTIFGVRKSDVHLEGSLDLGALTDEGNPSAAKSADVIDFLGTLFKNAQALTEAITGAFGDTEQSRGTKARVVAPGPDGRFESRLVDVRDTALGQAVQDILPRRVDSEAGAPSAAVGVSSLITIVSTGIAFYKFLMSPGEKRQTHAIGGGAGSDVELTGTIEAKGLLGQFQLLLPGASHTGTTAVPLYDKPLGVFNLRSLPRIDVTVTRRLTTCTTGWPQTLHALAAPHAGGRPMLLDHRPEIFGDWMGPADRPPAERTVELEVRRVHQLRRPEVTINPEGGFTAHVEAAYVTPLGVIDLATADGDDGFFPIGELRTIDETVTQMRGTCAVEPPFMERRIAIRVTIVSDDAPDAAPVTLVKLYPASVSIVNPSDTSSPIREQLVQDSVFQATML